MTVDIEWTYKFKDGEYPEWTLVVVTEGMKGLLRTAAAQNLSIDPETLRIQAHTRSSIVKSTGLSEYGAAELRISVEAEARDRPDSDPLGRPGLEPLDSFEDEHFNMDTPATFPGFRATRGPGGGDGGKKDDQHVQRECMIHQEPLGWCCDGTGA